ncbi:hypothetical protein HDU76_011272 [Blyttiomyces sp. JEL0837]|nr:hypothetical protein HDU76_011272 [Blyttiomyces sp. JEL0837]
MASLDLAAKYVCCCAPYFIVWGRVSGASNTGRWRWRWRGSQTTEMSRPSQVSMNSKPSQVSGKSAVTVKESVDVIGANESKLEMTDVNHIESPGQSLRTARLSHVTVEYLRPSEASTTSMDACDGIANDELNGTVKGVDDVWNQEVSKEPMVT